MASVLDDLAKNLEITIAARRATCESDDHLLGLEAALKMAHGLGAHRYGRECE